MKALSGKHVVLGITGGIAAYKSAIILREIQKLGGEVTVVMTANAARFVSPLTFETLSNNKVHLEMFNKEGKENLEHIDLSKKGDILLVAPATANILGKFANGIADDLLSTLFLSFDSPVLLAPAMNTKMYASPAVQDNLTKLKKRGVGIIEPAEGELSCGDQGVGRLRDTKDIIDNLLLALSPKEKILKGKKVLITAGPTREYIDPIRYISNRSSGKMGYALAQAAKDLGAEVTMIRGHTNLEPVSGVTMVTIDTSKEMLLEVMKKLPLADIVIMCAAVSDFEAESVATHKIKKEGKGITLKLKNTADILREVCAGKKDWQTIVGFAAETDNLLANAKDKLKKKGADFIVANQVGEKDYGIESDFNKVTIIDSRMNIKDMPLLPKLSAAYGILEVISKK